MSGMGHCTTGMSMCVCMYEERDVPISTLSEAHGLSRNVKGGGGQQREGEGRGEGGNLRGVSHRVDQHMVYTLCCGPSAQGEGHGQKRFPFQSQAWIEEYYSDWWVSPYQNVPTDNAPLMTITTYSSASAIEKMSNHMQTLQCTLHCNQFLQYMPNFQPQLHMRLNCACMKILVLFVVQLFISYSRNVSAHITAIFVMMERCWIH